MALPFGVLNLQQVVRDLEKRIEALESHIHSADELHGFTEPPIIPVEPAHEPAEAESTPEPPKAD